MSTSTLCEPEETVELRPQRGPQEQFLASPADVVIYGGGAGGGKSFGLCLEALRHASKPGFSCVMFRRTFPEITNPGGLWDTAEQIYPYLGATTNLTDRSYTFPGGGVVKFSHMQHEKHKLSWQGAQIVMIAFDELTHFSQGQFFYMISRNRLGRAKLKVRPYIRATCNPDPTSWVRKFIDWWIGADGYPIPERSGVLRWMARDHDTIVWADSREELLATVGPDAQPKSVTFIPAKLSDNPILMKADPDYLANLNALSFVEREQLLGGNWNVRATAGNLFKRAWFRYVDTADQVPVGGRTIRYWDRAATEPSETSKDPDWTVGVKMRYVEGKFYVLDVCRMRGRPDTVQDMMRACATMDGPDVEVVCEEDPGQAGKSEIMHLSRLFADRVFHSVPVSKAKAVRARPASAQAEQGNIFLVRAAWNDAYVDELESFADWKAIDTPPKELPHDDQVDGTSGAVNFLADQPEYRIRSL